MPDRIEKGGVQNVSTPAETAPDVNPTQAPSTTGPTLQSAGDAPTPEPAPAAANDTPNSVSASRPGNVASVLTGGTVDVPSARKALGPHEPPPVWDVPASVAHLIGTPEDKLDLAQLKAMTGTGSPFFQTQSDAFWSTLVLDIGKMMPEGSAAQLGQFIEATQGPVPIKVSTMAATLADGTRGNRVTTYGPDKQELIDIVKARPDDLVQKLMIHRKYGHQFGGPAEVCGGKALEFGTTHKGWFDVAQDHNGKDVLVLGDYPTNYGAPPNGTQEYSFRMTALSKEHINGAMTEPMSDAEYAEAAAFVRTLSVLGMGKIPFASGDSESWDQSYFVNTLDLDRGSKVEGHLDRLTQKVDAMTTDAQGNEISVRAWLDNRSRYCAEGAEDRPAFLAHAKPNAELRKMEKIFNDAVAAGGGDNPDNRLGWKALEDAGYIDNYSGLVQTNAAYMPFKVPAEGYRSPAERGLKTIEAPNDGMGNGLLSQPVTVAGLVEASIGTLLPRDQITESLAAKVEAGWGAASAEAKPAVLAQAQGFVAGAVEQARAKFAELGLPADQMVPMPDMSTLKGTAQAVGRVLASGVQSAMLQNPEIRAQIEKQARFNHMTAESKEAFNQLYGKFQLMVGNPTADSTSLQGAVDQQRSDIRAMEFAFDYPGLDLPRVEGLIVYMAPHHNMKAQAGWVPSPYDAYVTDCFPAGFRPE
ncbi:MAG: hypothetical protein AAFX94_01915 [Myxococcota bacterium]